MLEHVLQENTMHLNRTDLRKIADILEKFPSVEHFNLNQIGDNGIGTVTEITFNYEVNAVVCKLTMEISGVDNW